MNLISTVNIRVSKLFLVQRVWILFFCLLHYGVAFTVLKLLSQVIK